MFSRIIFSALVLFSLSFAIQLTAPFSAEVEEGDIIDLGTIGPGQTVSIEVNPIVTEGGIHGIGGQYDMAAAEDLPRGWKSKKSKLYGNPLQVTITADPDAPEGEYSAKVLVMDEFDGEELGNITFTAKIRITWDVMDFDVKPTSITVAPAQPARFDITITNKGSTGDVFEVSAPGPQRWEYRKHVFVPAKTSRTVSYEISGYEEESYFTTISVVSLASGNIYAEENVALTIKPGLIGDYRATNNGLLLFPIFEASIYSLAGLISNLFPN
ncbi:hypothetical protein JXA56_05230 [Candidatus Micrarchaeota archaeon]|nr:hypothetical protein [Candidatus Micrarchaeota archaeon]